MSASDVTEDNAIAALGLADADVFSHEPVATAAEQVSALASQGCQDSDRVAKNLFLKDNRNRFYLCTALHSTTVPFEKTLAIRLGLKKNELRMASAECMQEALKLEKLLADHGRQANWVDFGVTDVKVGKDSPPDLKAIADMVPEMKVKAEAKEAVKGTDSKKEKKAAKAAQKGPASNKAKAGNEFDPASVKCCLEKVMLLVEAAASDAADEQKPLTDSAKRSLERDVEMYLSSLQNSSFAAGLASGKQSAAALALGNWK